MLASPTHPPTWEAEVYRVYNHNHTLLGEFKTQKEANDEAMTYMRETGNAAYVMKEKL